MPDTYSSFRAGLEAGLACLWKPWFMSGVRNGGYEQTLRNVCMPAIEEAMGRTAFTESDGRRDLVLTSVRSDAPSSTACEFKTNFASQIGDIETRPAQALLQINRSSLKTHQDRIVVYAVAELVLESDSDQCLAVHHNASVGPKSYKRFLKENPAQMQRISRIFDSPQDPGQRFERVFEKGLRKLYLEDKSGFARLHVWTLYVPG
ncbi:hypothetical protein ACDW_45520 (plasmid) [Acidovorax sp. DW039]|uniref:hypothetical protein n=1 Tax=Acidovorax sp. DW039 TaxID=3095606 RepID=UPI00308AB829|nr:hypothetical protein ACDW_45520 [Acidovorax sp. DW039]